MEPKLSSRPILAGVGASVFLAGAIFGDLRAQTPSAPEEPVLIEPRARTSNIAVSGDFLFGSGNITLPVGFALPGAEIGRSVQAPSRDSVYYGGTLTWQITPKWGVDFSYAKGSSTGDFEFFPEENGGRWPASPINSSFTLDDTWYQGYVRYNLTGLMGTKFQLYLRGGLTYVDAEYEGLSINPETFYQNVGTYKDYTGNFGFGLTYRLFNLGESFRARAVLEGEGFAGLRDREFSEAALFFDGANSMDNFIYGGLGRLMLRADYTFGKDGQWRLLLDGGISTRWTLEDYSAPKTSVVGYESSQLPSGAQSDLLWGPFVRVGIRFAF